MPRKKKSETENSEEETEDLEGKDLVKEAEKESTISEKELEEKKKKLLEKVKALSSKVDVAVTEDLKEKVKIKKRTDMLVPLEDYVKTGIYIGTRVVTPIMKQFVYRRRADGLAIFNTDIIDEKLKEGIEYLAKFNPEDVILVCKRQTGWRAANMFSKLTGIKVFTKKYPAGVLTNTSLPNFIENELTIVTDSWLDKNALKDTQNIHKKVLMICDTNNFAQGADKIIIGNNKSSKSLGIIFYLLTKGYCKARGIEVEVPDLEWWVSEEDVQEEKPRRKIERVDAKYGV
jgi:small subunit ribosomal protein S2